MTYPSNDSQDSHLVIQGSQPLNGTIKISGAKNAALPILAASLLIKEPVKVTNVPKLTDINLMIDLLQNHGAEVNIQDLEDELQLTVNANNINNFIAPYHMVNKMRASIWVLAPLITRFGEAKVSLPGGCAIGARQVDLHISVLQSMGVNIEINHGYIHAKIKNQLKATHFIFNKISVGATITAILAACLAKGTSLFINCAKEPEIIDLCLFLNSLGADISGFGTSEITINGKNTLHGGNYQVMPDRIEAGTYMIAAAITKGELLITGINFNILENLALKMVEAGIKITQHDNAIKVKYDGKLKAVNVETEPYPGFSTDLQAQFMSLMCLAKGTSIITENIFENRFLHVSELCRMRANILIKGNSAIINGASFLSGAEVMASDLRASSSLILAGLAAQGETIISQIYHLDRGYQMLEQKLTNCGAIIKRVTNN